MTRKEAMRQTHQQEVCMIDKIGEVIAAALIMGLPFLLLFIAAALGY